VTIHLSKVLSELRDLHGLAHDGDVPRSVISRRLTELLRAEEPGSDRPGPAPMNPAPQPQGSTPSHDAVDSLP
jgi:hypothetical protein